MDQFDHDGLLAYLRRWIRTQPHGWQHRSVNDLADEFVRDAAFASIRLAGWLRSPDGRLVTAVVRSVLPAPYSQGVALLAQAITQAGRMRRNRQAEGLAVVGVAAVVALLIAGAR
jgi:hypothetical protein